MAGWGVPCDIIVLRLGLKYCEQDVFDFRVRKELGTLT